MNFVHEGGPLAQPAPSPIQPSEASVVLCFLSRPACSTLQLQASRPWCLLTASRTERTGGLQWQAGGIAALPSGLRDYSEAEGIGHHHLYDRVIVNLHIPSLVFLKY